MIIRLILILAILALVLWRLRQQSNTRGQALNKLSTLLLLVLAVAAVLSPDTTNSLAHFVGVGRGADLLLYCVSIGFIASLIVGYLHRQEDQVRIARLVRRIALDEASGLDRNNKLLKNLK